MAESFARLLKRHRIEAGLSQENLAELAGVSKDEISALERGLHRAPHKATLDLLIAALAVDDDVRLEVEEAAKLARARGPQAQRDALPSNLPAQLTSFVDRENVVAEIKEKLQSNRLVTLVGTGGVGKSRCAVQIGAQILDGFSDGVWLAELAPISDPTLVTAVIARTLGVQEAPNRPMLDTLLASLKRKRLLLILDNCEHLIDEASRIAAAILRISPGVRILATSRQSLRIAGEQAYRMPSLPIPSASELLSADEMSRYGATRLFSDRAVSADNRFIITVETAPHVVDICRRLDGIPLAIELAAAQVKALSPRQLAQSLDDRFRVLTAGDRSALPRHQTMRALIDWSYDLLSDGERALLRKLSIFAGGFTLEIAAEVCSEGATDEIVVLDLLSSLVDKSLVQTEAVGSGTRYRLLASTQQYAREKLRDAGDEETIAQAHASAFLRLAEQLHDAWETMPYRAWFAQVQPELENFRTALCWAFGARGDVLLGERLVGVLRRVWWSFAPGEGRRWVQVAQQRVTADTPDAVLAALDLAEASSATVHCQHKVCLAAAERALARYRKLADRRGVIAAEGQIGRALVFLGNIAEGETLLGRALEAARSLGAHGSVIFALRGLGAARKFVGDVSVARQHYREALEVARAVDAEQYAAIIATNLAETEFLAGDAAEAVRLADEALAVFRVFGETLAIALAGFNMSAYLVALGRYDEARTAARDALSYVLDTEYCEGIAWTLQHLAAIAALRLNADAPVVEDRRRAARILGYVNASLVALEVIRDYTEQQEYDAMIPALRDALGENELSKLMAEGTTWSEDHAVAAAMLI